MDNHTPEQRRKNMQAIKNKDSKIECTLRSALWHKGYRYRKNYKKLIGKPDIVFISKKVAVFCDSKFWHGYNFKATVARIGTNQDFWENKIKRNMQRDKEVTNALQNEGWAVLRFWEDEILKQTEMCVKKIEDILAEREEQSGR